MPLVDIRLATTEDAADISAMSRDYIEHGLPWGWTYDRVIRAINDPDINVAVVGAKDAVTAFGIMSYSDDEAHLLLFAVRRAKQRKGIGSAILHWLETVARTAGAKRIQVEARSDNTVARSFYCAHGYIEYNSKKSMYSEIEDGICLMKLLQGDT